MLRPLGDMQAFENDGIYGWIHSLIEQGKVARFVDRHEGVYELDWQDVVSKYWFEWRVTRRDSKSVFNHRNASNTLRSALLNSYKDKGAKEYPERKVMDKRNKTIKRCFRMPSNRITRRSHESHVSVHCCVCWEIGSKIKGLRCSIYLPLVAITS